MLNEGKYEAAYFDPTDTQPLSDWSPATVDLAGEGRPLPGMAGSRTNRARNAGAGEKSCASGPPASP